MQSSLRAQPSSQELQAFAVFLGDAGVGKSALVRALCERSAVMHQDAGGSSSINSDINSNNKEREVDDNGYDIIADGQSSDDEAIASSKTGMSSYKMVFSPQDLGMDETTVNIKAWEYPASSNGNIISNEAAEILKSALFCFILVDLRNPQSANSAFNKWMKMKETVMDESFCFVIGSHLSDLSARQLEVDDVARVCALKDAFYIEVCSVTGANVDILRTLICQRLIDAIDVRRELIKGLLEEGDAMAELGEVSHHTQGKSRLMEEISKLKNSLIKPIEFTPSNCNILSNIVGPSSGFNAAGVNMRIEPDEWKLLDRARSDMDNFVAELEREKMHLSKKILETTRTIEQMNAYFDGHNSSCSELDDSDDKIDASSYYNSGDVISKNRRTKKDSQVDVLDNNFYKNHPEFINLNEIGALFEVLGFNHSIPGAKVQEKKSNPMELQTSQHSPLGAASSKADVFAIGARESKSSSTHEGNNQVGSPASSGLIKMRIKLPTGIYADMVIQMSMQESQVREYVASFLAQHNISNTSSAFAKLENVVRSSIREHREQQASRDESKSSYTAPPRSVGNIGSSLGIATKACKLKLKVPAFSNDGSPKMVTIKVEKGDNVFELVRVFTKQYNIPHLTDSLTEKIMALSI